MFREVVSTHLQVDVAILTNSEDFRALEQEWEDLYHNSPLSTPFQSWSWLYSWWESFGEGYELRLITVWEGTLLVGVIPLMLERRWGFRRLAFIGKRSQQDLLARRGWEDKVSEAGTRALRQMDYWHVIDLRDVNPAATIWGIFEQWNGPRTHRLADNYVLIKVKPWDELLASLSRNYRQAVRRTLRRAEEDGVCRVLAGPEEVEQAARRLVALHRKLRQGRYITRTHLTPQFESFIVAAARRMTNRGLGRISELQRDGEAIISSFTVFGDKVTNAYLVGVSHEARQRYQWSSLGIRDALNMAHSRNNPYVCLAQAEEQYKQRWPHKLVPHYWIVLSRGLVSHRLYLMVLSLRARAAKYTKTDSIYKWIKYTAEWIKRRHSKKGLLKGGLGLWSGLGLLRDERASGRQQARQRRDSSARAHSSAGTTCDGLVIEGPTRLHRQIAAVYPRRLGNLAKFVRGKGNA
jgi:CelD/BcsL family acetyltransferase involved in cellulose biosynthesis